jgi:hypothetical protein
MKEFQQDLAVVGVGAALRATDAAVRVRLNSWFLFYSIHKLCAVCAPALCQFLHRYHLRLSQK